MHCVTLGYRFGLLSLGSHLKNGYRTFCSVHLPELLQDSELGWLVVSKKKCHDLLATPVTVWVFATVGNSVSKCEVLQGRHV